MLLKNKQGTLLRENVSITEGKWYGTNMHEFTKPLVTEFLRRFLIKQPQR